MRRKLIPLITIICSIAFAELNALEVNTSELKSARRVSFTNFQGPVKQRDSVKDILTIGRRLANATKESEPNSINRYFDKYSVIRAISPDNEEKLNADIFIIEKNAAVTHIRYIRHMIAGYLQGHYDYSYNDAQTLALFIAYYNAVYRGNMDFFSERYKPVVLSHITPDNAGIDTHYSNWAGKTRMIVPLTDNPENSLLATIDPTTLVDPAVRQAVREDDDNLPERKQMVELQKESIEKEKEELKEEKKTLEKEKTEVAEGKKAVEKEKQEQAEKKQEIAKKEETIKQEKEEAKKITDPEERAEAEKKIAEKEEAVEQEKEEVQKAEEETAQKEEAVAQKEEAVAQKEESVQEQRREIAEDELKGTEAEKLLAEKEDELKKKEEDLKKLEDEIRTTDADKAIMGDKLYYLKINEWMKDGHYNNELFMINAATMEVMKKSPVKNIGGRNYIAFSKGIVVITHPDGFAGTNYLTLVDRETLELITKGDDNIFWRSFVELKEGFIYTIFIENDQHFLGKFDENMKLVARSENEVLSDSFISFFQEKIYINSKDRRIMVLHKDDLGLIDFIKP